MSELLPPGYPTMWETHAVLADGTPVELRPVRPADRDLIEVFHKRQSPESIYFRFFQHRPELSDKELEYFTRIDYEARMAFVALIGGELVAVARYESSPYDPRPEVAFFVDDNHHGLGLATLLLEYLAAAARSRAPPRRLVIEQNPARPVQAVGFPVVHRDPVAVKFRAGIRAAGVKRRRLNLRHRLHQPEHLRRRGLIKPRLPDQPRIRIASNSRCVPVPVTRTFLGPSRKVADWPGWELAAGLAHHLQVIDRRARLVLQKGHGFRLGVKGIEAHCPLPLAQPRAVFSPASTTASDSLSVAHPRPRR